MNWLSSGVRGAFRLLLNLYPREFREEWSDEMQGTFGEGERVAAEHSRRFSLVRFWLREFAALFRTAVSLRWALSVESVFLDLKFGVRRLRRRPLFTAVSLGTLSLGIGSATAMFSVVNGVLLRPLPYRNPEELVQIWQSIPAWRSFDDLEETWDRVTVDWPEYQRWREGQTMFQEVAAYSVQTASLTGMGDPAQVSTGFGTASLLPLLGEGAAMGRWFTDGEDGPDAASVAVIGHDFWQRQFGRDPGVLGKTLILDDKSLEIIGVLSRVLGVKALGDRNGGVKPSPDVWVPVGALGQSMEMGDFNFQALGRLRHGATLEAAEPEAAALFMGEGQMGEVGARLQWREEAERGAFREPLLLLFGAAFFLLLIACGNMATLQAGEVTNRVHEVAAKTALGAGGGRLLRQFLTESVLLGLTGGVLGVILAWTLTDAILGVAPPLPTGESVTVDRAVLLFAVGAGIVSGLAFGLVPALRARWASPQEVLRGTASGEGKKDFVFQSLVVGGQMALTAVLLTSCLLLARSLGNLLAVDPGFDAAGLGEVRVRYPFFRYGDSADRYGAIQGMQEALAAVPGVESVTGTNSLPFSGNTMNTFPEVPGRTVTEGEQRPSARRRQVLPDYFHTLGVPILAGRPLLDSDDENAPGAVVVSQAMANRYWPSRSPLGEVLIHSDTFTVVGVAGDVLHGSLNEETYPTFYLPLAQSYGRRPPLEISFVIRTRVPIPVLAREFREAVWAVDPDLPVARVGEASTLVARSARNEKFRAALVSLFGLLATALAGAGVFGVTARRVARLRREMGICMALGADRAALIRDATKRTAAPGGIGLALGLALAWVLASSLSGFLFEVEARDPLSFLGAAVFLGGVMVLAAFMPAHTATAVPPAEVLRGE